MRILASLSLILLCSACCSTRQVDRPVLKPTNPEPVFRGLPVLPKRLKESCPPLPTIKDTSIASLIKADAQSSLIYAECQKKYDEVIDRYERTRREQNRQVERQNVESTSDK